MPHCIETVPAKGEDAMKKILIIDDSEHFLELIHVRLASYGYENYIIARSGQEGLSKIDSEKLDIVVLNSKLFDMNGFSLCRKIKEISPTIKIILISGMVEKNDSEKARAAGADEHVVKTFDCLILIAAIKKVIYHLELAA